MPYKRTAVADYARRWALSSNSGYGDPFENDCTNFVSQCLFCGGTPMVGDKSFGSRKRDDVWWFDFDAWTDRWKASWSWAGAQNLYNFLATSKRGVLKSAALDLDVGDVVQMKKDNVHHSTVVVQKTSSDLLVCYHTPATLDESLSTFNTRFPGNTFIYWKIDESTF
jgi:hypothetical protein